MEKEIKVNIQYKEKFSVDLVEPIYNLLIKLSVDQTYKNKREGLIFLENTYSKEKIGAWNENIVITVWDDKVFVGFGRGKHDGWVTHLFIDTPYQGKGLGSELLKRLEGILIAEGHDTFYLNSEPKELEFYKKRGYVAKDENPTEYHGILLIPMKKRIV